MFWFNIPGIIRKAYVYVSILQVNKLVQELTSAKKKLARHPHKNFPQQNIQMKESKEELIMKYVNNVNVFLCCILYSFVSKQT